MAIKCAAGGEEWLIVPTLVNGECETKEIIVGEDGSGTWLVSGCHSRGRYLYFPQWEEGCELGWSCDLEELREILSAHFSERRAETLLKTIEEMIIN